MIAESSATIQGSIKLQKAIKQLCSAANEISRSNGSDAARTVDLRHLLANQFLIVKQLLFPFQQKKRLHLS